MSENLIDPVEEIDIIVPLSVSEVEARLQDNSSFLPGIFGSGSFQGTVGGGSFSLRRRRMQRRNMRPTAVGTYESFAGGTRIKMTVSMPWWSKHLGRLLFVAGLVGGLGAGGALASEGNLLLGAAVATALPLINVGVLGYVVADAAADRGETAAALRQLFDTPETEDMLRTEAQERDEDPATDALERARRLRKMRQ